MSLFSLLKIVGAPVARLGSKALQKGSLPLAGLDLFEMQRASRGVVEQAKEGDKTGTAAEGLAAYGTTLFAPQTIDYAVKNNPKIMKALDVVTPKKVKTGYNLIKQGISKLPLSKTAEKYPIRTSLGIFAPAYGAEPIRDAIFPEAEAAPLRTPVKVEDENILNTQNFKPASDTITSAEEKGDTVAQNNTPPVETNIDQTISDLAAQDDQLNIPEQKDQPEEVTEDIKVNQMTETPEVNANKNNEGINVLQGSNDNFGENNPTPVPKFLVEASKALKTSINENKQDGDGVTTSLLLSNMTMNDEILKEKFKMFQAQKEEIERRREEFPGFEEFYDRFNQMAGRDVPNASKDFILLKFGLNLMQGRTDQQGMAGLLDVVGRAGVIAVDELQEIYNLEKQKREAMALKFLDFENTVKQNLDVDEQNLLASHITAMQDYQKSYNTTLENLIANKGAYLTALTESEKLEREAMDKRYEVKGTFPSTIPKAGTVIGFDNILVAENKFGEVMTYHTGLDGVNRPYLFPDLVKEVQAQIQQITNSGMSNKDKEKAIEPLASLLTIDMNEVRSNKLNTPFEPSKYRKNKSRLQTVIESINSLRKVRSLGASALDNDGKVSFNPFGVEGFFEDFISKLGGIAKDIFDKDTASAVKFLKMPVIPDDQALTESLSEITTFELDDGTKLEGGAAGVRVNLMYRKELDDANKEAINATDNEVNDFLKDNELVKKGTLGLEQKRAIFKAIKIAQVQLKYSLANSFKGEDRLTEKNLNEFGELTRFVGGFQSLTDVVTSLRELEKLAMGRLMFEYRTLINAGASEGYIRRQIGDKQFTVLQEIAGVIGKNNPGAKEYTFESIQKIIPEIKKGIIIE
jgi:hypothetical protein